jgi:hypothetical protein
LFGGLIVYLPFGFFGISVLFSQCVLICHSVLLLAELVSHWGHLSFDANNQDTAQPTAYFKFKFIFFEQTKKLLA